MQLHWKGCLKQLWKHRLNHMKFLTRSVQFPALKITVQSFWGLHRYFIHIGQGIAKHQKNSSQVFQWVFEHVWNYLSRYLDIPGCHGWYLACWQSRNKSFHPNKAECSEGFSVSCFITWICSAQKNGSNDWKIPWFLEPKMPLWEFYPQISQKSWT